MYRCNRDAVTLRHHGNPPKTCPWAILRESKERRTFSLADETDLKPTLRNSFENVIMKISKRSFILDRSQICIFSGLRAGAL